MSLLPLIDKHHAGSIIAYRNGEAISCGHLLAHARKLAATLPAHSTVINLCDDRYYFLLSFVATLLRGQLSLLPPNRSLQTIGQLAASEGDCYLISDKAEEYQQFSCYSCVIEPGDELDHSIPQIDAAQQAVRLYTSGSSGNATPHLKSWGMLAAGAQYTGRALGLNAGTALLATVPPQHMFGLETTVLLPLQYGCAIDNRRPLFPADIRSSLESLPEPRALITTPLQLRACATEQQPLPACDFILSATAPLSGELAGTIESLCQTTVKEIFGSTETGAIATRNTSSSGEWTLLDDYTLQQTADGWQVNAPHFISPQPLADRLSSKGRAFQLLGRNSDLIKVAGKRVSLGELNHILLSIDGVEDGVFFLPDSDEDGPTPRLAAAVVSSRLSDEEIIAAMRQRLDSAFLPRPLLRPARLPRNETGKLPRGSLLQLLERQDK